MQAQPDVEQFDRNEKEKRASEPDSRPIEALPSGIDGNPTSSPRPTPEPAAQPFAPPPAPPVLTSTSAGQAPPRPVFIGPGPHPRPPFPLPGAPPRPQGLPPGLAPALRGASPAQIAEMIAAARQIQHQRLMQQLQQQQGGASAGPTLAGTAGGAAPAGVTPAPGAANGAPPVPQTQQPAPPRPALIVARPAGAAVPPSGAVVPSQPLPGGPQQQIIPGPVMGHAIPLKRKADEPPGPPEMGYHHQLGGPPAMGMQIPVATGIVAGHHHAGHAMPSPSEEVATSAGEAIPALPAASVSAHYAFGNSGEMYDDDDGSGESGQGDGKKARLVWTQELHNRFINALSHLGLKHAVPKNILSMMNVEGMTRENVASHLQKYRLYLKKIGGHSEKDRIDPEVLQSLHEQNVQHMAAQQAMQHSMAAATGSAAYLVGMHHHAGHQHPYATAAAGTAAAGGPITGYGAHGGVYGAPITSSRPGVVGSDPMHYMGGSTAVQPVYVPPGPDNIVEGIPVSDLPVDMPPGTTLPSTCEPVSPTVSAAVATGGPFNLQGWQYPPLPIPDHVRGPPLAGPSGFRMHHHGGDGSGMENLPSGNQHYHRGGGGGGGGTGHQHHQQHPFQTHGGAAMGIALGNTTTGGGSGDVAMGVVADHLDDHHYVRHIHHHGMHAVHALPAEWHDDATDHGHGGGEAWVEGWPQHAEHDDQDVDDVVVHGGGEKGRHGSGNRDHAMHALDDEDNEEDPPLIPGVPSAGELHHAVVERLPMPMADTA